MAIKRNYENYKSRHYLLVTFGVGVNNPHSCPTNSIIKSFNISVLIFQRIIYQDKFHLSSAVKICIPPTSNVQFEGLRLRGDCKESAVIRICCPGSTQPVFCLVVWACGFSAGLATVLALPCPTLQRCARRKWDRKGE